MCNYLFTIWRLFQCVKNLKWQKNQAALCLNKIIAPLNFLLPMEEKHERSIDMYELLYVYVYMQAYAYLCVHVLMCIYYLPSNTVTKKWDCPVASDVRIPYSRRISPCISRSLFAFWSGNQLSSPIIKTFNCSYRAAKRRIRPKNPKNKHIMWMHKHFWILIFPPSSLSTAHSTKPVHTDSSTCTHDDIPFIITRALKECFKIRKNTF